MAHENLNNAFVFALLAIIGAYEAVDAVCIDLASNCAQNVNLCQNAIYRQLMQEKCQAACGYCKPGGNVPGGNTPASLLQSTVDDFIFVVHGDTQYFEQCIGANTKCKAASKSYRDFYHCNEDCYVTGGTYTTDQKQNIKWECEKIENTYANNVQFASINALFTTLRAVHQPRVLAFAGDLTNVGRQEELDAFTNQWLSLDCHKIIGLGNHDYENNIGKCAQNHCANRMLYWFIQYGAKHGLTMDYVKGTKNGKTAYTGSFAYAKTLCSHSGKQCSKIIQLNNRIDYTASFEAEKSYWKVISSENWLRSQLTEAKNTGMNVFIVCHHLGNDKTVIPNMIRSLGMRNRIFVLYAHAHDKQEIRETCAGIQVPFIYVGSVPNNRFTAIKLSATSPNDAEVFLMSAEEGGSSSVVQYQRETFAAC